MRAVMLSVLAGVLMAPVPFEPGPAPPRIALVDRLVDDLATRLEDPAAFSSLVAAQSNGFPEGPLFSRVLPAYGLISIARDDPARAPEMVAHLDVLLAQVLVETRRKVGTDVTSLSSYAEHGTWLGHVGVALGGYHLVGGTQFVAERERIASVLTTAIAAQNGAPIASYPSLTWSYDTTPALLAIHLDDVATGQDRAGPLLDAHLTWLIASGDPDLGLPYSRQIPNTEPPRGCDLSLRIAFLAQMDRSAALDLYGRYTEHFWVDNGVAGFREYPPGVDGPADIDSGPLLGDVGLAATGNGFAAVRAAGDDARHDRLRFQLTGVPLMVLAANGQRLPAMGGARVSTEYRTGFLYGDAALLNAAAWEDWGVSRPSATQP